MANPTVEKLKVFGLRHGEKIVVGLTSTLCVIFLAKAFTKPVIEITPDEVKTAATSANSNLNRPQTKESIIAKLDELNLKDPNFVAQVDEQKPGTIDVAQFAFNGPALVSPEPGAGLIRDTPQLIAPTELLASTGRGSIKVFKRDENGEFVYPKEEVVKKSSRTKKRARPGGMMAGMMPGMPGGGGAANKGKSKREQEEAFEKAKKEFQRKQALIAGDAPDDEEAEEAIDERMPDFENKGFRWVSLVGVVDHKKQVALFTRALKDSNAAPHYLRLDIQRQALTDDGTWPDDDHWDNVNHKETDRILGEIQSVDEEWTPENVRLDELVDPLPFLEVGSWRGVHVASLVPAEKRNIAAPKKEDFEKQNAGGMAGMMPGMSGMMPGMQPGMMPGMQPGMQPGMMPAMSGMMPGMMPGMGAEGSVAGPPEPTFTRTDAEKIMIRALDFMVDPDASYRYRVRLVVRNPNRDREDVAPGVDTSAEELFGPWSEPCEPVTVPADITTYALKPFPGGNDQVTFQVVKWNEADGLTIVKTFEQKPGEIIGTQVNASVPGPQGKGKASKSIDFTSRQLLLDVTGGTQTVAGFGANNNVRLEVPAQALVLRSDGLLVLRDQARDTQNPDAKRLRDIYDEIMKEAASGVKKKPKKRRPAGGMMGGMMGGGMR